jgi:uncharacterized protein YndB with AHSA1/START domain
MGSNPAAEVEIAAPIDVVWSVMLDTDHYPEWNPFITEVESDGPPEVGRALRLHVAFTGGKQVVSPERITAVEPPAGSGSRREARLSYVYEGWPSRLRLVRGVRHQRLTQHDGGTTRYETVEEFSGPLVPLAGPDRVAEGFRRHAEALKERAESLARRTP